MRERGNFNSFSNLLIRNHFILDQDISFFNNRVLNNKIAINKFG